MPTSYLSVVCALSPFHLPLLLLMIKEGRLPKEVTKQRGRKKKDRLGYEGCGRAEEEEGCGEGGGRRGVWGGRRKKKSGWKRLSIGISGKDNSRSSATVE